MIRVLVLRVNEIMVAGFFGRTALPAHETKGTSNCFVWTVDFRMARLGDFLCHLLRVAVH
jgi:hypothetical protein